jgi:nicotinate phosphoribosyltransferase
MGPDGLAATERILLEPVAAAADSGDARGSGGVGGRPLLRELVREGVIVGREPLATARSRHAAALAELPPYTLQLSRGYPAIPTKFGRDGEEG